MRNSKSNGSDNVDNVVYKLISNKSRLRRLKLLINQDENCTLEGVKQNTHISLPEMQEQLVFILSNVFLIS